MKLNASVFDLWVFAKSAEPTTYLLLHASQEKADKWFGGGRFRQIPSDFVRDDEALLAALGRTLGDYGLEAQSIWAVAHTYTIYNRRYDELQIVPVFAAEVTGEMVVSLTWEHSEFGWFTAEECAARLNIRGLREGLAWTREYITEQTAPALERRLA